MANTKLKLKRYCHIKKQIHRKNQKSIKSWLYKGEKTMRFKNQIIKVICCVFVLFTYQQTNTQIGCMDNSKHLNESFDCKVYDYVQCNCDCKKYEQSLDRGICSNCKHYHEPVEQITCEYKK